MISVSSRRSTEAVQASYQDKPEIRVLQVFSSLGMGGAETWLLSLLKYFHEAQNELPVRVKFDILLTGGAKDIFDDEAIALGARLFYVPFTRHDILSFIRKFRLILSNGNYHAIHDHQDYISGLHFLIGKRYLPPIRVAHVHNPLYHRDSYANGFLRQATLSAGKHLLGQFATHILGTSKQIVTEYGLDTLESRNVVLGAAHCGFDVKKYWGDRKRAHAEFCQELGWDESVKIILFVGRLEGVEFMHKGRLMSHKNPAFALEVAKNCIERETKVRFVMVGAGETKRREFEARVKEWGLEQKIRLLGVRHDVTRLMLGSDLLLFPSLAEGLGMVVVEAQASGLPILASDTTPRECVVASALVNFLSLEAAPSQWADKVLQLINLEPPDLVLSNKAVRDSAFSIENSARKLLNIYRASSLN